MSIFTRRKFLGKTTALLTAMIASGFISTSAIADVNTTGLAVSDDTVTVGILHSLTGTMAISETGAQQAEKLAIKQINDLNEK